MIAHTLIIELFVTSDENIKNIQTKFVQVIPFDLEEEEVELHKETAIGFNQQRIKILRITLSKQRHINAFLSYMVDNLQDPTKGIILSQAERRIDENLNFFLRFDKYKLLNEKQFQLIERGDCIFVKFKIAAFPKSNERAVKIIYDLFE
jgi:RNA binding exosome subunit